MHSVKSSQGKHGLLHISEIQEERTKQVEDVLKLGDQLLVKVIEIDKQGRVNYLVKWLFKKKKNAQNKVNNLIKKGCV
ncbi:Polyribonucleotide nucleotidyltransferase [Lysinibacillus sphaericus]